MAPAAINLAKQIQRLGVRLRPQISLAILLRSMVHYEVLSDSLFVTLSEHAWHFAKYSFQALQLNRLANFGLGRWKLQKSNRHQANVECAPPFHARPSLTGVQPDANIGHAFGISWPMLVPSAFVPGAG